MDGFCAEMLADLKSAGIEYSLGQEALFSVSLDHMRYSSPPECAVFAKRAEDIGNTLKICSRYVCPVTVRGSGTGCAAGCVPFCGGIVLDVSGINFIEIDPASRTAHVGAGAVTADVDAAAAKHGLMYAPDPSSHKYCSIGGNISCNAGGLRAAKYGVTRDNVLALAAYLADGSEITCGLPLKKFSAGPNLRDLFIGSEGTLGVVSQAWLRLLPRPQEKAAALAFFAGDEKGFEGIKAVMRSPLEPAVLEFMDTETVDCVRRRDASLQIPEKSCALLAEFDGAGATGQAEHFAEILGKIPGATARASKNEAEAEAFWRVRRAASPAMYGLANTKISQDIVLPFARVGEFFEFFKKLGRQSGLHTPIFGHAADGNYHIHFMYDGNIPGERERAQQGMDAAVIKAVELGGAVSGEHGIGALKAKYMALQHSPKELETMRKIKEALDPLNILNRGKVYFPQDLSAYTPLKGVKLPWD